MIGLDMGALNDSVNHSRLEALCEPKPVAVDVAREIITKS